MFHIEMVTVARDPWTSPGQSPLLTSITINRLPREVVEQPSLEILNWTQACDKAQSILP